MSMLGYAIPVSVLESVQYDFYTHQTPMMHPLCNVEQSLDWLMKPVGKLISRIYTSKK